MNKKKKINTLKNEVRNIEYNVDTSNGIIVSITGINLLADDEFEELIIPSEIATKYFTIHITKLSHHLLGDGDKNNVNMLSQHKIQKIVISNGINRLDYAAFFGVNTDNVTLPSTCKTIGHHCFSYSNVKNIYFSEGLTEISDFAFRCCNGLKNVVLPDSCSDIGVGVFSECESLSEITWPESCKIVNINSFYKCINLNTIRFKSNSITIFDSLIDIQISELDLSDKLQCCVNNVNPNIKIKLPFYQ